MKKAKRVEVREPPRPGTMAGRKRQGRKDPTRSARSGQAAGEWGFEVRTAGTDEKTKPAAVKIAGEKPEPDKKPAGG